MMVARSQVFALPTQGRVENRRWIFDIEAGTSHRMRSIFSQGAGLDEKHEDIIWPDQGSLRYTIMESIGSNTITSHTSDIVEIYHLHTQT